MGMRLALFSPLQWREKRSPNSMVRCRGRKRRPRGDDLVAPEIPLGLQIEILTRLPAKTLMRFKCVSKLWSSLILSRYLTKRHRTPTRPPRMYMSLVDHFECGSMEVCHNAGESLLLSLSPSSSNSVKSLDKELIFPGMGGHNMVLVRGLILYIVCRKACIYNPTTRQSFTLPAVKSNIFAHAQEEYTKSALYFLGYDPVLDQYKVVCTVVICSEDFERINSEHWVFVLEAGGSWKRIEFNQPHVPTRLGVCINGVIHYLASTCISRSIVVSFDVRSEVFDMIQVPHTVSAIEMVSGLIEYGGKPAILDHTNLRIRGMVDLWVLEDGEKWSKKSQGLRPSQMHLINSNNPLVVQGTTRNGQVILSRFYLLPPFYILYYDLEKNDLRKVKIRGIPDHWFSMLEPYFDFKLLDNSETIMHLEA